MNLAKLNKDVAFGRAGGKIIWQPRIDCWYADRIYNGADRLPERYKGMSLVELYKDLGCSNRVYNYNDCIKKVYPSNVNAYTRKISELETEHVIECPKGKVTQIMKGNVSNYGLTPSKWWVTCKEDLEVFKWIEENCSWEFDRNVFDTVKAEWGEIGAPTMFMERVNMQRLYIDLMGVEEGVYALFDFPDVVESYFESLNYSHERKIKVINESPIDIINFGDNLHVGTLPPMYFEKYVLPAYQRRNELLHKANKFTTSHWDGDVKGLLPYAKDTGLDGIEAITPIPQGDVTLEEAKEALGDMYLLDGIAAILFDPEYSEAELEAQTREVIELFAPNLILGISDEMSSTGDIERVRLVGRIVDEYNNSL